MSLRKSFIVLLNCFCFFFWRAPFTHVVGYRTPTEAFAGEVDTLLDPATYCSRWVSLTRVIPSG